MSRVWKPLTLPVSPQQSQDPPATMELAVVVLRDLLAYSCQLPELARDIGTNHILGLLTSLLALKPEVSRAPTTYPKGSPCAPLLRGSEAPC